MPVPRCVRLSWQEQGQPATWNKQHPGVLQYRKQLRIRFPVPLTAKKDQAKIRSVTKPEQRLWRKHGFHTVKLHADPAVHAKNPGMAAPNPAHGCQTPDTLLFIPVSGRTAVPLFLPFLHVLPLHLVTCTACMGRYSFFRYRSMAIRKPRITETIHQTRAGSMLCSRPGQSLFRNCPSAAPALVSTGRSDAARLCNTAPVLLFICIDPPPCTHFFHCLTLTGLVKSVQIQSD